MTVVHELVYAPKVKTVFTLTAERLHVETKGTVGAKADIPVESIEAFYATASRRVSPAGPRGAVVHSAQSISQATGELIIKWNDDGRPRVKRFALDTDTPSFGRLADELVRLRPDASLCSLNEHVAFARLGVWSREKQVKVGAITCIALLIIGGGILVLLNPQTRQRGRPPTPSPTTSPARR